VVLKGLKVVNLNCSVFPNDICGTKVQSLPSNPMLQKVISKQWYGERLTTNRGGGLVCLILLMLALSFLIGCNSTPPPTERSLSADGRAGQALFRLHCQSCHEVNSRKSGPALAGVSLRWLGAEHELLEFIRNSQAFMAAEHQKSSYARALFEASNKMIMPNVALNDEELQLILQYVSETEQQP
jgi:mono/diheme cytochrome c family protein